MKCMSSNMDSSTVVFLYKLGCFIAILPWALRGGISILKTTHLDLHIIRGIFSAGGSLFFMYSLSYVRVVDAVAVGFLEQVFWVIASILLFKEKVNLYKIIAIVVSFTGALLVIYPNVIKSHYPFIDISDIVINYNIYYIYTILAVLCWTCNTIIIKKLGRVVKNETQAFYGLLFSSITAFIIIFVNWKCFYKKSQCSFFQLSNDLFIELNSINNIYFFAIIVFYITHTCAIFKAMKKTEMSVLAPYVYFKLIFAAVTGYVMLGETPNHFSYIGYGLIVCSGIILVKYRSKCAM